MHKTTKDEKSKHFSDAGSQIHMEADSNSTDRSCLKGCLCDNLFMIFILIGVAVGFGIGFAAKHIPDEKIAQIWIQMPGDLYIRLLELTILPLIAANLIIVVAQIDPKEQGRNSIFCLLFILAYNVLSAAIGTALSAIIRPGYRGNIKNSTSGTGTTGLEPTTSDVFQNLFLNIIPNNIVGMTIFQATTTYTRTIVNGTEVIKRTEGITNATNMIGVLFVSIVFGLATRYAGERGRFFLDFLKAVADVVLQLMRWFLLLTPVGVCFMIAGAVMKVDDIAGTFADLGYFILTVVAGSFLNIIITLLLFFLLMKRNPFKFLKYCVKPGVVAFATTSPIVSIPEMYNSCNDYGIDEEVSRFVCPIATTLKADGPAIFISTAAMYVAQSSLTTVPLGSVIIIWLLTSAAVLAIPHIPSASIVIAITVMSSAGIPTQAASLLYAVDWFLDRLRCVTSTLSTMATIAIIDNDAKRRAKKSKKKMADNNYDDDQVSFSDSVSQQSII